MEILLHVRGKIMKSSQTIAVILLVVLIFLSGAMVSVFGSPSLTIQGKKYARVVEAVYSSTYNKPLGICIKLKSGKHIKLIEQMDKNPTRDIYISRALIPDEHRLDVTIDAVPSFCTDDKKFLKQILLHDYQILN